MTDPPPSDLPQLPPRDPDTHKGDYGRAILVGGSVGMTGAIGLAGLAALRSGAGLVTVATAAPCQPTVAAYEPSYMTSALPADQQGRLVSGARQSLEALIQPATAVACGPGLGRSDSLTELVGWLYGHAPQPTVFDADALFALATAPPITTARTFPRILTPHPGEFARLVGQGSYTTPSAQADVAVEFAAQWDVVLVLKGHRTLVTDGQRRYVNPTGNPGMATGGTGDVLTGIITGLLCQGLAPFDAARLGVYLHGAAGDLAAAEMGQVSLIARDLLEFLPAAFRRYSDGVE